MKLCITSKDVAKGIAFSDFPPTISEVSKAITGLSLFPPARGICAIASYNLLGFLISKYSANAISTGFALSANFCLILINILPYCVLVDLSLCLD